MKGNRIVGDGRWGIKENNRKEPRIVMIICQLNNFLMCS